MSQINEGEGEVRASMALGNNKRAAAKVQARETKPAKAQADNVVKNHGESENINFQQPEPKSGVMLLLTKRKATAKIPIKKATIPTKQVVKNNTSSATKKQSDKKQPPPNDFRRGAYDMNLDDMDRLQQQYVYHKSRQEEDEDPPPAASPEQIVVPFGYIGNNNSSF